MGTIINIMTCIITEIIHYISNLKIDETTIITASGFLLAVWQYKKESIRRKRNETLFLYNDLFKETYDLRNEYYNIYGADADLFAFKALALNDALHNKILNLLTHFESFAKGLEYDIYDFRLFIYQTPQEMFEVLNTLTQFVYEERKVKGYNLLFNDFIALANKTSICMQKKVNRKKIPPKYKRVKV